jgi:hypothetical protein
VTIVRLAGVSGGDTVVVFLNSYVSCISNKTAMNLSLPRYRLILTVDESEKEHVKCI